MEKRFFNFYEVDDVWFINIGLLLRLFKVNVNL